MLRLSDIINRVKSYYKAADTDLLKKAYVFADKMHKGQVRQSGEPFLVHPIEVAGIISELQLDIPSICTGLLHDTVEDTSTTLEMIKSLFGKEISQLVDGMTKLSKIQFSTREQKQAENFRKMIVAMAKDIRVILIKLADRTHNMRTLEHMPPHKKERISQETIDIYAPLANRLGIQWIRTELEDLSFRYLDKDAYYSLAERFDKKRREREKYIQEVRKNIISELAAYHIKCEVGGRPKHLYSIHQKMQKQGIEFDQVHDITAFRIILDELPQCYEALGIIHTLWKPIPGRFKDYVAIPKPNMYQSLHTTVIGPSGQRVEIQIRTRKMHQTAEYGIAAHWAYKEGRALVLKDEQKFSWLRQLMEWQQELTDPTEFLETVKVDLFSDEVYVFTPRGDVKALKRGATPVDFAYAIHSEIGHKCVGAKVNGRIVPLKHQLHNGDTLEIITSPHQHPNKDWLKYVKTGRARAKIRHYIRNEERTRGKAIGREVLDKEFKRYKLNFNKLTKSGEMKRKAKELHFQSVDELLVAVGYGKLTPLTVVQKFLPQDKLDELRANETEQKESLLGQFIKKVTRREKSGIKVQDIDDILVRPGNCCKPLPGDDIVGFITRGRGITVHTKSCPIALNNDPNRRIEVSWDSKKSVTHPVNIRVISVDQPGILATISACFNNADININQAHCTTENNQGINTFRVPVTDLKQLKEVLKNLTNLKGVVSAERV